MSEVNYGHIAIVPKSDFRGDVQYEVGNLVSYEGSSYVAHTRPPLATLPTDTNYWQLSAGKGETGAVGPEGKVGPPGPKGDKGDMTGEQIIITIPAEGWIETPSAGEYKYTRILPVEGMTAADIPIGDVTEETEYVAQNCGLSFTVASVDGALVFKAHSIPEADFGYAYVLVKGGV